MNVTANIDRWFEFEKDRLATHTDSGKITQGIDLSLRERE